MKKTKKLTVIFISILAALALITGIVFGCQALFDPNRNVIYDDVTIGGLDVGGMTRREAREALANAALETVLVENLIVELPKDSVVLNPYDRAWSWMSGKPSALLSAMDAPKKSLLLTLIFFPI